VQDLADIIDYSVPEEKFTEAEKEELRIDHMEGDEDDINSTD
jgi:hypothetical protein